MIKIEKYPDYVVSIDLALELKALKVPQKSIFGYYENGDFLCSAFTFDEIARLIPDMIQLPEETYVANTHGYSLLPKSEETRYASVAYQRVNDDEKSPFVSVCRYDGKGIAFSINENGKYNNLVFFGDNAANSAALMLKALILDENIDIDY